MILGAGMVVGMIVGIPIGIAMHHLALGIGIGGHPWRGFRGAGAEAP